MNDGFSIIPSALEGPSLGLRISTSVDLWYYSKFWYGKFGLDELDILRENCGIPEYYMQSLPCYRS
jgi:hypothetical protein